MLLSSAFRSPWIPLASPFWPPDKEFFADPKGHEQALAAFEASTHPEDLYGHPFGLPWRRFQSADDTLAWLIYDSLRRIVLFGVVG